MSIFDERRKQREEEQNIFDQRRSESLKPAGEARYASLNERTGSAEADKMWVLARQRANERKAEEAYVSSLSDADRAVYNRVRETGAYSSPYLQPGIEGKEKLTYNDEKWNALNETQRRQYLEWADNDMKSGKKDDSGNYYLSYARKILTEADTARNANSITEATKNAVNAGMTLLGREAPFDVDRNATTYDAQKELATMYAYLPDYVQSYLTSGILPHNRANENNPTEKDVDTFLSEHFSAQEIEKLRDYAEKYGNAQLAAKNQQEEQRRMAEDPLYAVAGSQVKRLATDLAVKPVAGVVSLWQGAMGNDDPYATAIQRQAEVGDYIAREVQEGAESYKLFTVPKFVPLFGGSDVTAATIYNQSYSVAENAARRALSYLGGTMVSKIPGLNISTESASKFLNGAIVTTGVFGDEYRNGIQQGMSTGTAFVRAFGHAITEELFEEISLDKLKYFSEAPAIATKAGLVKGLLKSAFVEGTEELNTEVANQIFDRIFAYDYSDFKAFRDVYEQKVGHSVSEEEAWWAFKEEFGKKVGEAFLGGALSGMLMGTGNIGGAYNRGQDYIAASSTISDEDYQRYLPIVENYTKLFDNAAKDYQEAVNAGENVRKGYVASILNAVNKDIREDIENAANAKDLNTVMENAHIETGGAISEETFNAYNAKLTELNQSTAEYKNYLANRDKATTFSDIVYGNGNNAISRNIVEASKSIAEAQENENLSKSERENTIRELTEKVEQNVKKAEEMVARYAEMGKELDSPEIRQFESVLGLNDMAQLVSAGKMARENNIPTTQKTGKLFQVKADSDEAKRVFGENASHIQEASFDEVKKTSAYAIGKVLSSMTGWNIGFYKSDRKEIQNGAFDPSTKTIMVDMNAGKSGDFATGEAFSHETTHYIRLNNETGYQRLKEFVKNEMGEENFDDLTKKHMEQFGLDEDGAQEEVVAEACQRMLQNSEVFKRYAAQDLEGAKTLLQRLIDFIRRLRDAFKGTLNNDATKLIHDMEGLQKEWDAALSEAIGEQNAELSQEAAGGILENDPSVAKEIIGTEVVNKDSVKSSQRLNDELMKKGTKYLNGTDKETGMTVSQLRGISPMMWNRAVGQLNGVARRMLTDLAPYLPEDIPGKVEVGNASYGKSMENALVCIRSIINNDFTDMVSEELGRPLTVEEQLVASQILQIVNQRPECNYCYVATDRRAYRASFNTYYSQFKQVYDKVAANRTAFKNDLVGSDKRMEDVNVMGKDKNLGKGVVAKAYAEFLDGRKNTAEMRKRFTAWVKIAINGNMPISQKDLTSAKVRDKARKEGSKKWFIDDAEKYAQSATWAKKMSRTLKVNGEKYVLDYVSYNGSILKWSQNVIDNLNSEFGLRMYSFSDYVPAFLLENMQMIMDASLRGLKVLAYTKDCGFAEAFADTGAGINISLFGTLDAKANNDANLAELRNKYKETNSDADRKAYLSALNKYVVKDGIGGKDGMMGANWDRATSLRKSYDNVGTVFVATNDDLVEWALANPDIDVVIPYHLVRTGEEVASFFNYKNYKAAQEDKKKKGWASGNKKSISPVDHGNDYATYKELLEKNNLEARFQEFENNPNYMKLVNETRMSYKELQPVRPVFNQSIIDQELRRIKDEGQYGLMPGFKTKEDQDAFIANQNLVGQAVDAIGEWNATGKKPGEGTKYSSRDSEGNELSKAQQEYFADSKVRDENGNLLVMYHGTSHGGFTVFNPAYSDDKRSLFFTDNTDVANSYIWDGSAGRQIYSVYLNLKNPLIIDAKQSGWSNIVRDEGTEKQVHLTTIEGRGFPFTFLSEEMAERFRKEYHINEWDELTKEAKENGTVFFDGEEYDRWGLEDLIDEVQEEAFKEYESEVAGSLVPTEMTELRDHPENFTWFDLYSLMESYSEGNMDDDYFSLLDRTKLSGYDLKKAVDEFFEAVREGMEYSESYTQEEIDHEFDGRTFMALPHDKFMEGKKLISTRGLAREAEQTGHDGVIIKNIWDVGKNGLKGHWDNGYSTVVVALNSNQVKSVDNTNPTEDKDIRFSFRGENSNLTKAEKKNLDLAKSLDEKGEDSEKIRLATGWFKGMDGKWRNELDDSKIKFNSSYIPHPMEIRNMWELPEMLHTEAVKELNSITDKMMYAPPDENRQLQARFNEVEKEVRERYGVLSRAEQGYFYLSDLIEYPALFKAYPSLGSLRVNFAQGKNYNGQFDGTTITLDLEDGKTWGDYLSTLMHEVQHKIQRIEKFAQGSDPEYWRLKIQEGLTSEQVRNTQAVVDDVVNKLRAVEYHGSHMQSPEMTAKLYEYYDRMRRKDKWSGAKASYEYDVTQIEMLEKRAEEGGYLDLLKEYLYAAQDLAVAQRVASEGNTQYDLYYRTAGEIEARDVQSHLGLTAKQRKEKRPDIDRSDVVFVEDEYQDRVRYSSRDSDGNELSADQQKYFADSKVRDENGNLQVVYHGTGAVNGYTEFYVFEPSEWVDEVNGKTRVKGYFSENEEYASNYGQTAPYYLNIKNPLNALDRWSRTLPEWKKWFASKGIKGVKFDTSIEKDTVKGGKFETGTEYSFYEIIDNMGYYWNGDGNVTEKIEEAGYDGICWDENGTCWVPFNRNAIKRIDNTKPTKSDDIRYSLRSVPSVEPTTDEWQSGHSESWFRENGYPIREDVSQDWLQKRIAKGWWEGKKELNQKGFDKAVKKEGTQISSTVSTYEKLYDMLQKQYPNSWKDLRILDASSGLGLGTKVGLERGFDVTDIEPYVHPDSDYFPDYMDYSSLQDKVESGEVEPFDFIISNAVLNVIPQDTRDAMVKWFDSVLAPGGELFVSTLGAKYTNDKTDNDGTKITQRGKNGGGSEIYVKGSNSVQKGFSRPELQAYLRDALGDGYAFRNAPSGIGRESATIATKEMAKYSSRDSDGNELTEAQQEYFKDSKIRDANGNLKTMFHGTEADFNIFDFSQGGKNGTAEGFGIYLTDNEEVAKAYGGRIIKSYVNVTKPAMFNKKTITSAQLTRLIETTAKNQAQSMIDEEGYGTLEDALKDTWISNYTYTYDKSLAASYRDVANSIIRMSDNDRDIIQEVMAGMAIRDYDKAVEFYDVLQDVLGFDGFVTEWKNRDTGEKSEIVLAFNSNQVKNIDNLNPTMSDDIRYSERNAESESEVIVKFLQSSPDAVKALGAKDSIVRYAKEYKELKAMEEEASTLNKRLKNKKSLTDEQRQDIMKRLVRLDRAIVNKTTKLTDMRTSRVLRDVLNYEFNQKEVAKRKARSEGRALANDRNEINKRKDSITKKAKALMKMIESPTEKKHIPSIMVKPIAEMLDSIDFWSVPSVEEGKKPRKPTKKSASLYETFSRFKQAYEEISKDIEEGGDAIQDLFDPDFIEYVNELTKFISDNSVESVNDMSLEQIRNLDQLLTELNHVIKIGNNMMTQSRFKTVDELRDATVQELNGWKGLKEDKSDAKGNFVKQINAGMADAYAWGEYAGSGAKEIVKMLSKAYNRKINLIRQATDFTMKTIEPFRKDIEKWQKTEEEFKLASGQKVKMTISQMIDLYELSKREQALGHVISGEGVGGIKVKSPKGKYTEIKRIANTDLEKIFAYLKKVPHAIEVGDKLQQFLATTVAEWGNRASNLMYGIIKFTDKNYWPIRSTSTGRKDEGANADVSGNVDRNKIKNTGATKAVVKNANNAVEVEDFLNVFSKHVDELSSYSELLPAITDAQRWWNSRTDVYGNKDDRVKDLLARKLGSAMAGNFNDILIGLNGGTKAQDSLNRYISAIRGKVKAAAIALNPRVVVQQPFAYTRAAAVIEPKYLMEAMRMIPSVKEAQEHSAIAWLKHQGFHSSGIGPSMKKLITGEGTVAEKITEKTMAPAGFADDVTWGALWNAAKLKVEDTQKSLKKGSQEYWKAVEDIFDEVINRTQVVETPLTQSPWMKSNMGSIYMAFMNEPVKTYSMVMTALDKLVKNPKSPEEKKNFARAVVTFTISGFALALSQSLIDAARDDDKEKSYWEKYLEKYLGNSVDNLNPLTYLPLIKDAWSLYQGFSSNDLTSQSANNIINAIREAKALARGESKYTLWGSAEIFAKALSYSTGIPVSNAMRIFTSMGNLMGIDTFRRKNYTKSELGRNVILELRDGNYAQADKYWQQLVKEVGEDNISDAYNYLSDYLSLHDEDVDEYAVEFLDDATKLERQATNLMRKYDSEYITLDVATDSIRKAAREDQKEAAKASGEKYKQTISSGNAGGTIYNGSDINRALEQNDVKEAQMLIDAINAGYVESDSNSTAKTLVSNYWKPKYLAAKGAERDRIAKMLYKLRNKGRQMFSASDLQKWVKDAQKKK